MSETTVQEAIEHALRCQRGGDLDTAEEIYRQVLQTFPDQADALHLLGALQYQRGEIEGAIENLRRAIASAPGEASFRLTLGGVYQGAKRFGEAIGVYEELIARRSDIAAGHDHLGVALSIEGRDEEAVREFRRALALDAGNAGTLGNLGIALCRLGEFEEAIGSFRGATDLARTNYSFRAGLGNALYYAGKYEEAIACCRGAVELTPGRGEAHATLCAALIALGRWEEAVEAGRRAVALLPALADVRGGLGEALRGAGRVDEAVAVYEEGLRVFSDAARLHDGLGIVLRDVGEVERALGEFRRAMEVRLEAGFHSHFLFALQFHPVMDASAAFEQHREFSRIHAEPLARGALPQVNDATPGRRLRVGYLAVDLRSDAVAYCLRPLLEHHDRDAFEIFSYVQGRGEEERIARLRRGGDHWRSVDRLTDEKVAEMIRGDGIDMLVDLRQHGDGNRILIFARKAAPVQISFGGYPGTTGLSMMDYRLTDRHVEPAEGFPAASSETPILLPDTVWCYSATAEIDVTPLPALRRKQVSFGYFGEFRTINESVLRLWSKVLKGVEGSTLTVAAPEGAHRARVRDFVEGQGVARERILFVLPAAGRARLESYGNIDIGLDTFPVNGHAASLDAFFMGVPVITLVGADGAAPVSRTVWSQLVNLRLVELGAFSGEEFVDIAVKLAKDLPRLGEMRGTLRTRMMASPLVDGARYARNVEAAYRTAWERWCRKRADVM